MSFEKLIMGMALGGDRGVAGDDGLSFKSLTNLSGIVLGLTFLSS